MKNKTVYAFAIAAALALMSAGTLMARPGGGYGGGYGNCGGPGFGGGPGGPGMGMGGGPGFHMGGQMFHHLDRMQYFLGLTDKQVEKIFNINKDYMEKFFKNRKNFDAIQKLRESQRKDIESVLTAEQKKKLNEMFQRRGPGKGFGPGYKGNNSDEK